MDVGMIIRSTAPRIAPASHFASCAVNLLSPPYVAVRCWQLNCSKAWLEIWLATSNFEALL